MSQPMLSIAPLAVAGRRWWSSPALVVPCLFLLACLPRGGTRSEAEPVVVCACNCGDAPHAVHWFTSTQISDVSEATARAVLRNSSGALLTSMKRLAAFSPPRAGAAVQSPTWRADTVATLCDRKSRGTLLGQVLRSTAAVDGVPAAKVAQLEEVVASRGEGSQDGGAGEGFALATGCTGPSQITVPDPAEVGEELRRRIGQGVRFLSLVGNEGSGHHALTPVVRRTIGLLEGKPIREQHDGKLMLSGGGSVDALYRNYMRGKLDLFLAAAAQLKDRQWIQQEYSFPTGGGKERLSTGKQYDLTAIHLLFQQIGVVRTGILRYDRNITERATSLFRRWPHLCAHRVLSSCIAQQREFDEVIDTHLQALARAGTPVLHVTLEQLDGDCNAFVLSLADFLRDHNLLDLTQAVAAAHAWKWEEESRKVAAAVCAEQDKIRAVYLAKKQREQAHNGHER